jgi:hypothetical protein
MRGKEIIADWTSRRWHSTHNWHTGTGRFIKKTLARKKRHENEWKDDLPFKKDL